MKKLKVLVTGCAGFVGSHLTERLLNDGFEVLGIDSFLDYYSEKIKEANLKNARKNPRFEFIKADILELELKDVLEGVDCIFHQAAQAGVRSSWGDSFQIYTNSNILATQRLLEACARDRGERGIRRFVYASSSSVYGDTKSLPTCEHELPRPISPYGVSKLAGEHLCYLYWKNFGIPTIALRYFTVYGPRQRPDMAFYKFIDAIFNSRKITIYGDGNQTRDFTFVSDIVEANILAIDGGEDGNVYNIGGGSRISVNRIIDILEKITGKNAVVEHTKTQKGDVKDTYADISKAEADLGYKSRVSIEEGLKKQVMWHREHAQI